ncbi:hypothetical protein SKAU_G00059430 [Synaphobranchus kaupii]|uniref:Gelsolin n=1 Tax=Synaphobranchus kaupii TaxID=118154 RepID=A0A9Q1JA77_SYNKA|nr:hypothetical protein SKAU_G00059430 [Synaphobranchus kaupii]
MAVTASQRMRTTPCTDSHAAIATASPPPSSAEQSDPPLSMVVCDTGGLLEKRSAELYLWVGGKTGAEEHSVGFLQAV